jgi:hypothetical protein
MARASVVVTVALVATVVGCGRGGTDVGTHKVKPIERLSLPAEIVGLKVSQENVGGALRKVNRTYVDAAGLVSMRTPDNLVQATLQINRFQRVSRYRTASFRRTVASQLGSTEPQPTRMEANIVWRTTGTKQVVAVWFRDLTMYRLAIRDDFDQPRTLIRALVDLDGL